MWFADYAKEYLVGCTCKVLRRAESLKGTMFLCSQEESGALPKQIRRRRGAGKWADVWGIQRRKDPNADQYVVQLPEWNAGFMARA